MAQGLTNPPVTEASATVSLSEPLRTVTYEFDTAASGKPGLQILYAVVIDGRVREQEASRAGTIDRAPRRLVISGLKKGAKIGLYLNTDACVGWREREVCQVTVSDLDVVVKVAEKMGQGASTAHAVDPAIGKEVYRVPLDGALWMKISHAYTATEAREILAQEKDAAVRAAVQRVYDGLEASEVSVTTEAPKKTLRVLLHCSSNASGNIAGFNFLEDGVKRVHPLAYAAVFRAGLGTGVATMEVFSGWRPLTGSIHHRAGIGLDVTMLGDLVLNRGKLVGDEEGPAQLADNVAEGEQNLLERYRKARQEVRAAEGTRGEATGTLRRAEAKLKADRRKEAEAQANLAAAKSDRDKKKAALDAAAEESRRAREDYEAARAPYEQAQQAYHQAALALAQVDGEWRVEMAKKTGFQVAATFREALASNPTVVLIYDPWFMDFDTHDKQCGTPNTMEKGTDGHLHRNHFHISVRDVRIPL